MIATRPISSTRPLRGLDKDAATACIGVFDSGVGGLSVLRELHQKLPEASIVYVGDVAFAPYGPRPSSEVLARCERIVRHLAGLGASLIVVACNTATVQAIDTLRNQWPSLTFVGVEPGIKPGVARSRGGRIAVMATAATVRSARLRQLVELHAAGASVLLQPCPGLADAIEAGVLDGPALTRVLIPYCARIAEARVDTVVLACTHYAFVADAIQLRISAIVDARFSLIVDGETASSKVRRGGAQAPGRNVSQPSTISLKRHLPRVVPQPVLGLS